MVRYTYHTPRHLKLGRIKDQLYTTTNIPQLVPNHQHQYKQQHPVGPQHKSNPIGQDQKKNSDHNHAFRRLGATLPRQIPRQLLEIFQPQPHSLDATKLIARPLDLITPTESRRPNTTKHQQLATTSRNLFDSTRSGSSLSVGEMLGRIQ